MGQLESLRQSLTDMTFEEKLEKIRQIREERRNFAPSPAKEKKVRAAKANNMAALAKALAGLSAEELEQLLGEDAADE